MNAGASLSAPPPVAGRTATSWGSPFVTVPVLSTMSVSNRQQRADPLSFMRVVVVAVIARPVHLV